MQRSFVEERAKQAGEKNDCFSSIKNIPQTFSYGRWKRRCRSHFCTFQEKENIFRGHKCVSLFLFCFGLVFFCCCFVFVFLYRFGGSVFRENKELLQLPRKRQIYFYCRTKKCIQIMNRITFDNCFMKNLSYFFIKNIDLKNVY